MQLAYVLNPYSILTFNCIQNISELTIDDDVQDSETDSETGENYLSPITDTQSYRKTNLSLLPASKPLSFGCLLVKVAG